MEVKKKFTIKDTEKYMVELYKVEADNKEMALDKYVNELAGSLEPIDHYYDPCAEDNIEVIEE